MEVHEIFIDQFDEMSGTNQLNFVQLDFLTSLIGGGQSNGSGVPTQIFAQLSADYFHDDIVLAETGALIAAACEAGVFKAGGSDEQRQAVRLYGENIGLAFQIVDDLLDYQGDPEKTGKAVGNDLVEGKMTLPLIHALRLAADEDRQALEKILAVEAETRQQHFAEAKSLIDKAGGFGSAGELAKELVKTGLEALSSSFGEGKERQTLGGLAGYVLSRDK